MTVSKIDVTDYRLVWVSSTGNDGRKVLCKDISNNIIRHDSRQGLTFQNDKVSVSIKIIRDKLVFLDGEETAVPFYVNDEGTNLLNTRNQLQFYIKYYDGTPIDTDSNTDLVDTYDVTNWSFDEASAILSLDGVRTMYKATNKVMNRTYGEITSASSGFTTSTNILTHAGAAFPIPGTTNTYNNGYVWQTLELETTTGVVYTYLITDNSTNTLTTHKTIATETWAAYRVGYSSPSALYNAFQINSKTNSGKGSGFETIKLVRTADVGNDYKEGIQFLRNDSGTTSAFPIISIGQAFYPMNEFIEQSSGIGAINSVYELANGLNFLIRDMIAVITWSDNYKQTIFNWFYPTTANVSTDIGTITDITDNFITFTGYTGSSSDIGNLCRISYTLSGKTVTRSYTITAADASIFTLSAYPAKDGIDTGDTFKTFASVDFVWDNEQDYHQIYNFTPGSKDEELFNHILFNCGNNPVSDSDVIGHWFNSETNSSTLKEKFIPMTFIAKRMISHEKINTHIRINNGVWEGWDGAAFTTVPADWNFTTNFGNVDVEASKYVISSQSDFVSYFRVSARKKGQMTSKAIALNQKENTLSGTFKIRGQKFISISATGNQVSKFYEKGTRIMFKKPNSGLNNLARKYYNFIIKKVRSQVTRNAWIMFIDVEYDAYKVEELN